MTTQTQPDQFADPRSITFATPSEKRAYRIRKNDLITSDPYLIELKSRSHTIKFFIALTSIVLSGFILNDYFELKQNLPQFVCLMTIYFLGLVHLNIIYFYENHINKEMCKQQLRELSNITTEN